MLVLVLILLGLVLGSFINALVWRLHEQGKILSSKRKVVNLKRLKQLSVLNGRSMCPKCHHQLAAKDLVPMISWLMLRGKCHYCHKSISVQYPLVEAVTAGLFVFSYYFWPLNFSGVGLFEFIIWLIMLTGFVALAIFDFKWFILPDKLVYPLIALAALQLVVVSIWQRHAGLLLGALWGTLVLAGLFYLLFLISKGRWIGGGDVKLGVLLGILVGGPLMSILLLFIASLSGSVAALPLMASGKAKANSRIPFGPFLLIAATVVELFGAQVISWYKNHLF